MSDSTPSTPAEHLGGANKRLAIIAAVIAAAFVLQLRFNIIPFAASQKAAVPTAVDLPTGAVSRAPAGIVTQTALPSSATGKCVGALTRVNIWAWNAQMGFIYANGGSKTTA